MDHCTQASSRLHHSTALRLGSLGVTRSLTSIPRALNPFNTYSLLYSYIANYYLNNLVEYIIVYRIRCSSQPYMLADSALAGFARKCTFPKTQDVFGGMRKSTPAQLTGRPLSAFRRGIEKCWDAGGLK
jgi:hypothetical protein